MIKQLPFTNEILMNYTRRSSYWCWLTRLIAKYRTKRSRMKGGWNTTVTRYESFIQLHNNIIVFTDVDSATTAHLPLWRGPCDKLIPCIPWEKALLLAQQLRLSTKSLVLEIFKACIHYSSMCSCLNPSLACIAIYFEDQCPWPVP